MWLDEFPHDAIETALHRCLAADKWIDDMMSRVPFGTSAALYQAAFDAFSKLNEADWLQAFAHHPKIGSNAPTQATPAQPATLSALALPTSPWSNQEQAGMKEASAQVRDRLRLLNEQYEQKFGFIYLVNATGKSADELLRRIEQRMPNAREQELPIAADELRQIMRIRLEKLIAERGPITTHVLDQALGKPGAGISVTLAVAAGVQYKDLATRRTDKDGRVGHFMIPGTRPAPGLYRLHFELDGYPGAGFFPFVELHFQITQPEQHHHVPLLLSPFGFSTYRGS